LMWPKFPSGQSSYIYGFCVVVSGLFLHSGSGWSLHNVQSFIFRILTEDPTVRFTTSSPMDFKDILLDVILLPRCNHCLEPSFLIPVMLSGSAQRLLLNVGPFQVPLATLSWPCSLRCAGMAWQVNRPQAVAYYFQDPPLPCICFFSWLRRHKPRYRSPCHFFSAPMKVSIVAYSSGTSACSASYFTSSEVGSLLSRQASVT
jgi:hypothetical protein